MKEFKVSDVVKATGGKLLCGDPSALIRSVSIDSRNLEKGALFVPLKGTKADGHNYIKNALDNGAIAAISELSLPFAPKSVILVPDTLSALSDIALYYRELFSIPFVAITGSVGKTTTKDMVTCVLDSAYTVHKTKGNFNNEIGLPLTLLGMPAETDIAVTEMGMSAFGEITKLTKLVKPSVAIITNIGMSHIEKLGSQENILKAKLEILEGLSHEGLLLLNGDDPLLYGIRNTIDFETIYYGIENKNCDFTAYDIVKTNETTSFKMRLDGAEHKITLPVLGIHNVYNALAAIITGIRFNIDIDRIIAGLANFVPSDMRMNIIKSGGVTYISDCYNASPSSNEAALKVLRDMDCFGRRICVLGDMLEMGSFAKDAHKSIGKLASESGADILITVGENGKFIAEGAYDAGMTDIYSFSSPILAKQKLKSILAKDDIVLVKGSRGMHLEQVLP